MTSEGSTETARGQIKRDEPTKPQQAAARRVAESKATIPHLRLDADVGFPSVLTGYARDGMVVRALALALRENPRLNGAYRDGGFEEYSRVNVAFAAGSEQAAPLPTILDADTKPPEAITAEMNLLAAKAGTGQLTSPDLSGATFTVFASDSDRVSSVTPIIPQGQAASLGIGAITERAGVVEGRVVASPIATLSLACDARIIGIGDASSFIDHLSSLLEESARLA